MKRILSLVLAFALLLGLCSFAVAEEESNPWSDLDLSEYKEINFIIPGNKPAAFDEILGKANERMKELINTTVNFDFVSYGEFGTRAEPVSQRRRL